MYAYLKKVDAIFPQTFKENQSIEFSGIQVVEGKIVKKMSWKGI